MADTCFKAATNEASGEEISGRTPQQQFVIGSTQNIQDTHHHHHHHLRTVIKLNNVSSDLLEAKHWRGPNPVIATLRDAIELLSELPFSSPSVDGPGPPPVISPEDVRSHDDAVVRAEARLADANANAAANALETEKYGNNTNQAQEKQTPPLPPPTFVDGGGPLLIYARPFRLVLPPPTPPPAAIGAEAVVVVQQQQHRHHTADEISAALLYNMALAYHLEAAAWSRQTDDVLRRCAGAGGGCITTYVSRQRDKALAFYELCSSMAEHLTMGWWTTTSTTTTVTGGGTPGRLVDAVLNNAGQICVEHGDHERGRDYFRDLEYYRRRSVDPDAGFAAGGGRGMDPFEFNVMVATSMNAAATA